MQVESLDLPVKRNQAFIIKFFSKTRDKFCDHILGEGEDKVQERRHLLTKVCMCGQGCELCDVCDPCRLKTITMTWPCS